MDENIDQHMSFRKFAIKIVLIWGGQKLMGENLKLIWAKITTISLAVSMLCTYSSM